MRKKGTDPFCEMRSSYLVGKQNLTKGVRPLFQHPFCAYSMDQEIVDCPELFHLNRLK